MQSGEECLAWVSLTRAPALDAAAVSRALQALSAARHLVRASSAAYARAGLPATACEFLSSVHAAPTTAERAWLDDAHHHVIPFTDPHYPALLRTQQRHPLALYVAGNPGVLNDPQLAIVGSRNPSPQGRAISQEFAEHLAARGLAITSGLAVGIDSAAHRGALMAQGVTLALLGSGADVIYPRANCSLAREIQRQGAVVSAFPLGTAPRREHFPQRNALIAGISLGTLVVEAARRSGSLITARLACDLGRELFAIPGSIHNPLSRGCHELIRQGAKLTETAHDILSELNFSAFFAHVETAAGAATSDAAVAAAGDRSPASGMDKEHKILLDALGFDPADLDVLVVRTGFKPEAVSSMMLILELEGHVQAAPGGRYSRVVRSRR